MNDGYLSKKRQLDLVKRLGSRDKAIRDQAQMEFNAVMDRLCQEMLVDEQRQKADNPS